eukprot:TRINITY_DN596_c0_g2_i1.p1 TRINITY_DN596_c0_g2~~TRINITY_DN596_c0_g2_i1.p1  ORF type:complete len:264 (-),score=50.25 TRINITY_DN596_c0_g2_i1:367-1158(-)
MIGRPHQPRRGVRVKHALLAGAVCFTVLYIIYMISALASSDTQGGRWSSVGSSDVTALDTPIILSDDPRIAVIHNFFTADECEHLVRLALAEKMSRTGDWSGRGTFLWKNARPYMEDPKIIGMEDKIVELSSVPAENLEHFYVQHIAPGQAMDETLDAFNIFDEDHQEFYIRDAGQRILAIYVFLNDVAPLEGNGDFKFTRLKLKVPPRRGTAIIFHPCHNDRTWNTQMMHLSNQVVGDRGMWVASKWVRERNFHEGYTLFEV